jgi:uncharacterized protein YjeT (DUF2065 family)
MHSGTKQNHRYESRSVAGFTNKGFKMKDFLCVLGMVFIIEGIPYFVFPEKLKIYLAKMITMPDSTLRFLGIFAMIIGLVLLYFGRS